MFNYENKIQKNVKKENVWKLYCDVKKWSLWDISMDNIELDGDFVSGSKGKMYIKNMPPLPFELVEVTENKSFTVIAQMGDIKVSMGHFIKDSIDFLEVTHTISIDGNNEGQIKNIGLGMSKTVPSSMEQLLELAGEF